MGVAAQYASALGKTANCQTMVSLTLARGEVPVMLALRLFLPESWTSNQARLERAGVPADYRTARSKPEIALAEIDRAIAAGVRFGCVLADAGVWAERAVPPGAHGSQACLGGRYSAAPQGIRCRCADDLAHCRMRPSPPEAVIGHRITSLLRERSHPRRCRIPPRLHAQSPHTRVPRLRGAVVANGLII